MPHTDLQLKQFLVARLDESRRRMLAALAGVDDSHPIHDHWCVRDILGHLAVWELEAVRSLRAYRGGGEYHIPAINLGDFDSTERYNHQAAAERASWTNEQIHSEWESVRQDFRAIIHDIPDERYPGDMLYPWGVRGTIAKLIDEMVAHEDEHRASLLKALGVEQA